MSTWEESHEAETVRSHRGGVVVGGSHPSKTPPPGAPFFPAGAPQTRLSMAATCCGQVMLGLQEQPETRGAGKVFWEAGVYSGGRSPAFTSHYTLSAPHSES